MGGGQEDAFQQFFELYFQRLFRYLLAFTRGDEHAAKEALQETLIRVARHVRRFDEEKAFWDWLTVLARSAAHDGTRKRFRYWNMLKRFVDLQQVMDNHSSRSFLGGDEGRNRVLQAVALLPSLEHRLIEGKYFEGLSVRELAQELNLTEKSAESHLLRARQKLREILNRNPDE